MLGVTRGYIRRSWVINCISFICNHAAHVMYLASVSAKVTLGLRLRNRILGYDKLATGLVDFTLFSNADLTRLNIAVFDLLLS